MKVLRKDIIDDKKHKNQAIITTFEPLKLVPK